MCHREHLKFQSCAFAAYSEWLVSCTINIIRFDLEKVLNSDISRRSFVCKITDREGPEAPPVKIMKIFVLKIF